MMNFPQLFISSLKSLWKTFTISQYIYLKLEQYLEVITPSYTRNTMLVKLLVQVLRLPIGHVSNIPTMQFFTGISRNTQSKSSMLSVTECVWDFQNNASWDTH